MLTGTIARPVETKAEAMIRAVLLDFGETLVERISDREVPLTLLAPVLFPETAGVLHELKRDGYLLAVVSNTEQTGDEGMDRVLRSIGIRDYIDAEVTSTSAGSRKPEPAIFLCALRRVGCSVAEAMMIGDNPDVDIAGGAALGMRTILVRRERPGPATAVPDFIVTSLLDVPPILRHLQAVEGKS
jgi:HAD superfamily hydrolase (TIGR01662 family)